MVKNFLTSKFDTKIALLFLITIAVLTIFTSNLVYTYEAELSRQDSKYYILLAQDINNYFKVYHQVAMRVLPSFLAMLVSNIFSLSIFFSFKILTYIFFIILLLKTFFFFKKFNIPDYLAFSSVLIIFFFNNSVVYTIFNSYQLLDLMLYLFSLMIIEGAIFNKKYQLFIFSFLAIFTKEFLIMLILSCYITNYLQQKDKKIFLSLLIVIFIFFMHYNYAGSLNFSSHNITEVIIEDIGMFNNYINGAFTCLILNKNFLFFLPFIILLTNNDFINLIKNNSLIFLYMLIPVLISIFLYNLIGSQNFFRVCYQGFFIFVLFSLIFLTKKIDGNNFLSLLYFLLPLCFLIDFIFIFLNINQHGFFKYYQETRYEYFSGFYLFSIFFIFIFIRLKKLNNEKKSSNI